MIQGLKLKLVLSTESPFLGKVASHKFGRLAPTYTALQKREQHWTTFGGPRLDYMGLRIQGTTNIFIEVLKKTNKSISTNGPDSKKGQRRIHIWGGTRVWAQIVTWIAFDHMLKRRLLDMPDSKAKTQRTFTSSFAFSNFDQLCQAQMWYRYHHPTTSPASQHFRRSINALLPLESNETSKGPDHNPSSVFGPSSLQ